MKLALVISTLFFSLAYAGNDSDSCGAGWYVTQKKSLFGTSTRGTTNGTIPPTFGMTSGTSGCAQHSLAKKEEKSKAFTYENYDSLIIDMAVGEGESLLALSSLLECDKSFALATKENFKNLYADNPEVLFQNIMTSNLCQNI